MEGDFFTDARFEFTDAGALAAYETLNSTVLSKDSSYKEPPFDPADASTYIDSDDDAKFATFSKVDTGDYQNPVIFLLLMALTALWICKLFQTKKLSDVDK